MTMGNTSREFDREGSLKPVDSFGFYELGREVPLYSLYPSIHTDSRSYDLRGRKLSGPEV